MARAYEHRCHLSRAEGEMVFRWATVRVRRCRVWPHSTCTGGKLFIGSKVPCMFCLDIYTPEGRGENTEGNFKKKHTESLTQEITWPLHVLAYSLQVSCERNSEQIKTMEQGCLCSGQLHYWNSAITCCQTKWWFYSTKLQFWTKDYVTKTVQY